VPPPDRTFWQRLTGGIRRLLPRAWRGEAVGLDDPGYLVHPLDLYDGQKGIEHSLYSMIAAWRRRCGGAGTQKSTSLSDQHVRDLARLLERYNPFAQAILTALRSYVLAEQGLHVELAVREGADPAALASPTSEEGPGHFRADSWRDPILRVLAYSLARGDELAGRAWADRCEELGIAGEALLPAMTNEMLRIDAQHYLDEWMDREDWWSRERELYVRCHRDGEGILRYFAGRAGVRVRFVEPECVIPPDGSPEWAEGVRTDPDDAETLEAIWVQTGMTPADGEEVPADELYMIKCNADRCLKRGLSDFASISGPIMRALDCLTSMIGAEGIRQGIVMITQHEKSAPADLDAFIAGQTDYTDRSRAYAQSGPAREVPTQTVTGVREVHLTGAQKLAALPPAGAVADATGAINTALLSVGSRYHMPLWVISGDASRNNALDLQAEGPFGRFIKDEQAWFSRHVRNVLWRVLEIGVDRGELPAAALEALDLHVSAERSTEQRDPTKETERNQTLFRNGLMGKPTWSSREGLDFDAEQDDLKRFGGPPDTPAVVVPPGYKAVPAAAAAQGGPTAEPAPSTNGQGVPP
jgi:hypothetical protein